MKSLYKRERSDLIYIVLGLGNFFGWKFGFQKFMYNELFLFGSAIMEAQENVVLVPHVSIFPYRLRTLILYLSSWRGEVVHRSHILSWPSSFPPYFFFSLSSVPLGLKSPFSYQSVSENKTKFSFINAR